MLPCIFEGSLLLIVANVWREKQALQRPIVTNLTESHWAIVHVNFIFVLVLQSRPEE